MIFEVLLFISCFCTCILLQSYLAKSTRPPELSGGLPIIGQAWKLLGDRKHAFQVIKSVSEEVLMKGGILTATVGHRRMYLISDPDDCAKICNECLDKDYYYKYAKSFLGNGLTIADVPLWKQHRKLVVPAFRLQILNGYLVVFNNQAKRLVNQFKQELGKGPFNLEEYVRLNSLESICLTAFGADIADFGGLHTQYLKGMNEILSILTERLQKIWLHSDFIYNWSNLKTREDAVLTKMKEFTSLILAKRKAEMEDDKINSEKLSQYTPFMNLILELSKENGPYSEEDVLNETNTLVGGGYDTIACTMALALMLLGSHPEVQKRAHDELKKVFENSDRDVEKHDLPKLVYIEAVLKETMRLYPTAPIIARYIAKDVQVQNYTLEAGNGIVLFIWAMHRHKMWGHDAEKFRPERWLDGSLPNNPNAFGSFSIGKRGCPGKSYAMMSMKTTLSHVLRSYIITSDISKLELEFDTLLKIASGQNIIIERR